MRIETIEELEILFNVSEVLSRELTIVFRGVKEAKYKLYTTAQRDWITNEWQKQGVSFINFIEQLLSELKENTLLIDYLQSMGIIVNDLLLLSFLQHYGSPTPLLDFTHEREIALFFAIDAEKQDEQENSTTNRQEATELDDYCSLYIFPVNNSVKRFDLFTKPALDLIELAFEDFPKLKEGKGGFMNQVSAFASWIKRENTAYGLCEPTNLTFIPNPLQGQQITNRNKDRLCWSNLNLLAQKGCFFLNPISDIALEDLCMNRLVQPFKLMCFDIHKSLRDFIRTYLIDHKTSKERLFPDFKSIAQGAYEAFKRNPTAKISLADLPDSKD